MNMAADPCLLTYLDPLLIQIRKKGKVTHLVDGADESFSNWTRYMNCARDDTEENITTYQARDKIYFRTKREIKAGEELLYWYGDQYAKILGLLPRNYKEKGKKIFLRHNATYNSRCYQTR